MRMGKTLHSLCPQNHYTDIFKQTPYRNRCLYATGKHVERSVLKEPSWIHFKPPKIALKEVKGCQRLGKQNSFSQPEVFPFLEQETQFEDLQASLLNFVGLEWFKLQVLVWGI